MNTNKFIELCVEGEASAATNYLNSLIASKAFEALSMRKEEMARTFFGGNAGPGDDEDPYEDEDEDEYELEEERAYDYDRYKVHNGKATIDHPMRGERDQPHHVWAENPEHALEKFKNKAMKK